MYLDVLSLENKVVKKVELGTLFALSVRYDLIHQLILWQQAKKRSPISHTKEISAVSGSTRKIYRQKGTGKARHGSIRGAQFVGGGVIFGPSKNKVYNYKVNKKVRKIALLHSLALKYKSNSISIRDKLTVRTNRFKDFVDIYGKEVLTQKTLFISDSFDDKFIMATRNNYRAKVLCSSAINVLDIIKSDVVVFSEDAFENIVGRLGQ